MKRKIEKALAEWGASSNRKPLIVNGARQVGKTYSVMAFAQQNYERVLHIDFSAQPLYGVLFEGDITPSALLPQIEVLSGVPVDADNTLLFFDEVQACPRALMSLKYFCEQAPEYHVIAAGSLLGVALARKDSSFPVGKVDMLPLHPLDFEEFLWAMGEEALSHLIRDCYVRDAPLSLHEYALDWYRKYLLVGGLPEVVQAYAQGKSMTQVGSIQETLTDAYLADMTKYASPVNSAKILNVWRSVPEQLAKENHKFQYATIASSARAHQYEAAINWLQAAGLVAYCYRVDAGTRPLKAHVERDFFKLYLFDVGLLSFLQGVSERDLLPASDKNTRLRGGITENYVMQQLQAAGVLACYWGTASKSEVDFVVQKDGDVIPIEVKSGGNVSSRSLEAYRKAYRPPYVLRLSTKNFGFEGGIRSIPLYAAFCLGEAEGSQEGEGR